MSLAPAENGRRPSAAFGLRGIEVRHYDELVRFAQTVSESGLAPKGMEKPQAIFVAIQMGLELGLSPMASLQNVAVVNGRPTLWGDAQLAVCRGTGEMKVFEEWYEQGGVKSPRNPTEYRDDTAAVCRVQRTGGQVIEQAFSVADAKRAGLWGKQGPWTQYPFRMLRNRARSFALRDGFGDALRGFRSAEEAMDSPDERIVTGREVPAAKVPLFSLPGTGAQGEPETRAGSLDGAPPSDHATPVAAKRRAKPAEQGADGGARASNGVAVHEAAAPAEGTPERGPAQMFWDWCDKEGLDSDSVLNLLRKNMLSEADYPADLTDAEAESLLAPKMFAKIIAAVKGGAA